MTQVTIMVSMVVVSDRPQTSGQRSVTYEYKLEDNLNNIHTKRHGPKIVLDDLDIEADMIAIAPSMINDMVTGEQNLLRNNAVDEQTVLHDSQGEKLIFRWDTWDNHARSWLQYWFSRTEQLDLVYAKLDTDLISNSDLVDLLSATQQNVTDMHNATQLAFDTKAGIDVYVPLMDESGNWVEVP